MAHPQHVRPVDLIAPARQALHYAAVGACGTGLHYLVMAALMLALGLAPIAASTGGALCGAAVNYGLNYRFTFRSQQRHRRALPRFALVAALGVGLNALLLGWALRHAGLPTLWAQLAATAGVLGFTFLANRRLTF